MTEPSTIACRDEDFTRWHGGCRLAALWAIDVDGAQMREAVQTVRNRWADVLLTRYERQPHVTLAYRGLIPHEGCRPRDMLFTATQLERDVEALRSASVGGFTLRSGQWATFPMVPYLMVGVAPELAVLHEALGGGDDYVPHVTAGQYSVSVPIAEVAARAAGWAPPSVEVEVASVALMTYETHDVSGPLTVVGRFDLESRQWLPTR